MNSIPAEYHDLLKDESKAYLFLATSMPDGSPQVTPVWFDTEGEYIRINTAEGRVKDRNMKARPSVALVIQDPADPYRYVQVRGDVESYTNEGADEHINRLSWKYNNRPWTPNPGKRIIFRIRPTHIDAH